MLTELPFADRCDPVNSAAMRIRTARRALSLTQTELAQRLDVSRSAVAQWERSSGSNPVAANLQKLAVALECSFEWLATGRGPRQPSSSNGHDAETAATLRHFARDEAEDQLLLLFRGLDARDRQVLLTVASSLTGGLKQARRGR